MSDNYEKLKSLVSSIEPDYEKFRSKKVKAAGARVRNNLLNCKKICDILRKEILDEIKEIPVKPRASRQRPIESPDEA